MAAKKKPRRLPATYTRCRYCGRRLGGIACADGSTASDWISRRGDDEPLTMIENLKLDTERALAIEAVPCCRAARAAGSPAEMATLDEFAMRYVDALAGDPRARQQIERDRNARRQGAMRTNAKKQKRYMGRDAAIRRRYPQLVRDHLETLVSEKQARADAVRALAHEHHVNPQRTRDVLNAQ